LTAKNGSRFFGEKKDMTGSPKVFVMKINLKVIISDLVRLKCDFIFRRVEN